MIVVPVPWEATVSYGSGAADGPAAVFAASVQIDLFDAEIGRPYERGIAMLPLEASDEVRAWSDQAQRAAAPVIAAGGPGDDPALHTAVERVNGVSEQMNGWVRERVAQWMAKGRTVFLLGGDHSTPFGAIAAHADAYPGLGILHLDAHYDLRPAYEGFTWSHASIMRNVLDRVPGVERIVHVGVRDFAEEEHTASRAEPRSTAFPDRLLRRRMQSGECWADIADAIVARLPEKVYLSFDIDGLDPVLCPGTGTPVPGGLSWDEIVSLMAAVVESGREIVGGDLVEVAPQDGDGEWNANVGARLLYKMLGFCLLSRKS